MLVKGATGGHVDQNSGNSYEYMQSVKWRDYLCGVIIYVYVKMCGDNI